MWSFPRGLGNGNIRSTSPGFRAENAEGSFVPSPWAWAVKVPSWVWGRRESIYPGILNTKARVKRGIGGGMGCPLDSHMICFLWLMLGDEQMSKG